MNCAMMALTTPDGYLDDDSSVDAFEGYLDTDGDGYAGGALQASCDDIYYATSEDCDIKMKRFILRPLKL